MFSASAVTAVRVPSRVAFRSEVTPATGPSFDCRVAKVSRACWTTWRVSEAICSALAAILVARR
jgi:hypothetical protein